MTNRLAYYEERAKSLTLAELNYAIRDIMDSLRIWQDFPITMPYNERLLAEFDAFTVEASKRRAAA